MGILWTGLISSEAASSFWGSTHDLFSVPSVNDRSSIDREVTQFLGQVFRYVCFYLVCEPVNNQTFACEQISLLKVVWVPSLWFWTTLVALKVSCL